MEYMIIIALLVIWYAIGISSFIYWWTKDYNFEAFHLFVAMFMGVVGPLAFIVGMSIHGGFSGSRVLIKKRKDE
jgi:prolipoprotein diacylglyceryltransferase